MLLTNGSLVLACGTFGLWGRARIESSDGKLTRVRFVDEHGPRWLPKLSVMLDADVAHVTAERIAALPETAPTALPPPGTRVIALWDGKRFHKGVVERHVERRAVVGFDEGDTLTFTASELLPCGLPIAKEVAALRTLGLELGVAVTTTDKAGNRREGWVSEVGSGRVYVRWSGVSYGLWMPPERMTLGGRGRRREPTTSRPLAPGSRVRARWVDREYYDAVVVAVSKSEVRVHYDDGTEQALVPERVIGVNDAPPQIAQDKKRRDAPSPAAGTRVLAEATTGYFKSALVLGTRGAQTFVKPDDDARVWAWGTRLAVRPADRERFVAKGTSVVIEVPRAAGQRGKKARATVELRPGRVGDVLGDRVAVRFADGTEGTAALDAIWQRHETIKRDAPALPSEGVADVEREPDVWEEAQLDGASSEGMVRVRFTSDGKKTSVDPVRVKVRPVVVAPPPRSPPPPPVIEYRPLPLPGEVEQALLGALAQTWGAGGYRGGGPTPMRVDESSVALPVDRGTLLVRVRDDGIEITADRGESDVLPPVDGPLVRFARWLGRWGEGPSADVQRESDDEWARGLDANATAARAKGALTVTVPIATSDARPQVVVNWARAVWERCLPEEVAEDAA